MLLTPSQTIVAKVQMTPQATRLCVHLKKSTACLARQACKGHPAHRSADGACLQQMRRADAHSPGSSPVQLPPRAQGQRPLRRPGVCAPRPALLAVSGVRAMAAHGHCLGGEAVHLLRALTVSANGLAAPCRDRRPGRRPSVIP